VNSHHPLEGGPVGGVHWERYTLARQSSLTEQH